MRKVATLLGVLALTLGVATSALGAVVVNEVTASCSGTTINYTVTGTADAGDELIITLMGNTNASGENEMGYTSTGLSDTYIAGTDFVLGAGGSFSVSGSFDISGIDASVKSFRVDSNANEKSLSFNRDTCPGTEIPEAPFAVLLVITAGLGAAWFVWRQSRSGVQPTAAA
jgi:hypothetical protein